MSEYDDLHGRPIAYKPGKFPHVYEAVQYPLPKQKRPVFDRLSRWIAAAFSSARRKIKLGKFWCISQWCRVAGHKWPDKAQFQQKHCSSVQDAILVQIWRRSFRVDEHFYCKRCTKFLKTITGKQSDLVEVGAEKPSVLVPEGHLLGMHTPAQIAYFDKQAAERKEHYDKLLEEVVDRATKNGRVPLL